MGRIKRAVQTGWEIPLEAGLALERENQQLPSRVKTRKRGWRLTWKSGLPKFTGK